MRKSTIFAIFKIWKRPSGRMTDSAITPNVEKVFNLPATFSSNREIAPQPKRVERGKARRNLGRLRWGFALVLHPLPRPMAWVGIGLPRCGEYNTHGAPDLLD